MKKLFYLFTILFTCVVSAQQEFSYGVVLGNNFYTIENNNGTTTFETEDKVSTFTIGGYSEYNFTENIGVKLDMLFSKKEFIYFPNKQVFEMTGWLSGHTLKHIFAALAGLVVVWMLHRRRQEKAPPRSPRSGASSFLGAQGRNRTDMQPGKAFRLHGG